MSSSPTPSMSCDDYISTEELFQSFMDVAFIAEQELKNNRANSTISNSSNSEGKNNAILSAKETTNLNNNKMLMPLPLLLKTTSEPIYECVPDQQQPPPRQQLQQQPNVTNMNNVVEQTNDHSPVSRKVSNTNSADGTIVTVLASPTKRLGDLPTPDYPGANDFIERGVVTPNDETTTNNDYDSLIQCQTKVVTDVYAVVDKTNRSKQNENNLQQQQQQQLTTSEDRQEEGEKQAKVPVDDKCVPFISTKNDTYETIVIAPSAPVSDEIETKVLSLYSDYAIIESPQPQPPPRNCVPSNKNKTRDHRECYTAAEPADDTNSSYNSSSNYESVEDLKLDLSNQRLLAASAPSDSELSPEIIAFGFHFKRLQSESQQQLMDNCLSTIDRSARNSDKKKHFFGFGKHKNQQQES